VDAVVAAEQQCAQMTGSTTNSALFFGGGPGGDAFVGSLADFAIWNRPLSVSEISQLHAQQVAGVPPSLAPVAPSGLTAQPLSATTVALTWQDNSMNESGFVLERASDGVTFLPLATEPANSVSYTDAVPVADGIYSYRIKAVNNAGASDYSNTAVAGTATPAPAGTASFGSAPAVGTFTVSAPVGTAWLAVANQPWIHTTSSGVGLGEIDFSIDPNPSIASRSGTITVPTGIYLVVQDGARNLNVAAANLPAGVPVTLTPMDNSGNAGGVTLITRAYNTNDTVVLTAPSSTPGFAFQKWQQDGLDLTDNPTVSVVIHSNHTLAAVYRPAASYGFDMGPLTINSNGGSGTYAVAVTLNTSSWTLANVPSWLHLSSVSGMGSYSGTFTVDANTGPPRTGVVTLVGEASQITSSLSQGGIWWPLWWQSTSGYAAVWSVQGRNCISTARLNSIPASPGWNIVGTADFSGNGYSDLLWQSTNGWVALWVMNGTNCLRVTRLNSVPAAPGWRIVGTGDFAGNGRNDILWQSSGGWVAVWLMDGTNFLRSVRVNSTPLDSTWKVVGAGDFDGDGQTDILFQSSIGWIAVWFMNGTTMSRSARLYYQPPDSGWQIVGTTDIDGDGQVDLLWRHQSGSLAYWLMQRTTCVVRGRLNPSWVDPAWKVVGPR
jgi:hypothetical protein